MAQQTQTPSPTGVHEVSGYEVVVTGEEMFPYELRGPRGARYGLTRNVPNPSLLFPVNMRSFGVVERLGWFTDEGGVLRRVR